jgi:hypothetical protein
MTLAVSASVVGKRVYQSFPWEPVGFAGRQTALWLL